MGRDLGPETLAYSRLCKRTSKLQSGSFGSGQHDCYHILNTIVSFCSLRIYFIESVWWQFEELLRMQATSWCTVATEGACQCTESLRVLVVCLAWVFLCLCTMVISVGCKKLRESLCSCIKNTNNRVLGELEGELTTVRQACATSS